MYLLLNACASAVRYRENTLNLVFCGRVTAVILALLHVNTPPWALSSKRILLSTEIMSSKCKKCINKTENRPQDNESLSSGHALACRKEHEEHSWHKKTSQTTETGGSVCDTVTYIFNLTGDAFLCALTTQA